jgi:serine/threonine protein kinase, bacterial
MELMVRLFVLMLIVSVIGLGFNGCNRDDLTPVPGMVSTFASAEKLMVDGKKASIVALATDPAGNLYAADAANRVIRKLSPSGEVTTLAGSGKAGYKDGTATTAQFGDIVSLACDSKGNLYVGEGFENSCIRKITPDGVVSTLASQPFLTRNLSFNPSTSPDGVGTSAIFIAPVALIFDSVDNLYASDAGSVNRYSSNAIRRITPDGTVQTIAGSISGLPNQGQLIGNIPYPYRIESLAISKTNTLVGIDWGNQLLYQITLDGNISVLSNKKLSGYPGALLYDKSDRLLVAYRGQISQITPEGELNRVMGSEESGYVDDLMLMSRFGYITDMVIDKQNTLYIADAGNKCIRKVRLE